jgi:hypothetical protein
MTSVSSPKWNDDDDELLAELRVALQEEPVDENVIQAAQAAFTWRLADAEIELLTLVADYSGGRGGGGGLAPMRVRDGGPGGPQRLVFHGERIRVEMEIDEAGIVGQLIPPQPAEITLVTTAGPQATTEADEVGCFSLPRPGAGPIRLECQLADCRFVTEWATT